jgi:hypothetical protein
VRKMRAAFMVIGFKTFVSSHRPNHANEEAHRKKKELISRKTAAWFRPSGVRKRG